MSFRGIIDRDPMTGVETVFHGHGDGTFHIEERFDAEATIEANKAAYNDSNHARWTDANHIASIPLPIYNDLARRGIVDDRKAFLKWLQDPDNRAFLRRPGRFV